MILNYKKRWFAACQGHLFFVGISESNKKKMYSKTGVHLL